MTSIPARIVLVHDLPSILNPLAAALRADGYDVAAFNEPMEAWELFRDTHQREVLVTRVDFGPDKPHGMALTRWAQVGGPTLRVLFVCAPEFEGLAGDLGIFMPVTTTVPQLVEAIVQLLAVGQCP